MDCVSSGLRELRWSSLYCAKAWPRNRSLPGLVKISMRAKPGRSYSGEKGFELIRTSRMEDFGGSRPPVKPSMKNSPPPGPGAGPALIVVDRLQPAPGVLHEQDLAGLQLALADGERADHVVGDDAAGVAQYVRLAVAQPQRRDDVEARVHAGDDRQSPAGADVEVAVGQRLGEVAVVVEQLVDRVHGAGA